MTARRALALAVALGVGSGCGTAVGPPRAPPALGEGAPVSAASDPFAPLAAVPIGRSRNPRSGRLSYRLGNMARDGGAFRVDVLLHNGTGSHYRSMLVQIVLRGSRGELQASRVPVGPLGSRRSRWLTARLEPVDFPVADVAVELLYAVP